MSKYPGREFLGHPRVDWDVISCGHCLLHVFNVHSGTPVVRNKSLSCFQNRSLEVLYLIFGLKYSGCKLVLLKLKTVDS